MITLYVEENNPITPTFYESLINNLQLHQLTCTCGFSGCLHIHGYYYRFLKTHSGKHPFHICRVKCSFCGRTHAILPSFIVPYSHVPLSDQVAVIDAAENNKPLNSIMNANILIDESNCRHIIRQYARHWKQKLLSQRIHPVQSAELVPSCFRFFSRQFMQIKCTPNILFLNTT